MVILCRPAPLISPTDALLCNRCVNALTIRIRIATHIIVDATTADKVFKFDTNDYPNLHNVYIVLQGVVLVVDYDVGAEQMSSLRITRIPLK